MLWRFESNLNLMRVFGPHLHCAAWLVASGVGSVEPVPCPGLVHCGRGARLWYGGKRAPTGARTGSVRVVC